MATNKKPGNPWNQFPKKKAPGKLATRTPKPNVTPSRAVGAGGPPAAPSSPVKQVRVKDVTPTKPSQGSSVRTGQPAPARPSLQASGSNNTPRNPTPTAAQIAATRRSDAASRKAGAALGSKPSGKPVVTPPPATTKPPRFQGLKGLAGTLGNAATGASVLYGVGSQWQAVNPFDRRNQMKRPGAQPLREMTAVERSKAVRLEPYNPNPGKPKPKPASTQTSNTSSTPSASSPAPRPQGRSSSPARQQAAPSKPAAPEVKQSKDMNENYRIWAAANSKLADKVKKGQAGYNAISKDVVSGMGPLRDSASYKPSVSSSDTASTPNKDALKAQSETDKKKKKVNG
jgi:hypothetical protein